jgi:hypothetical protein
MAHMINVLQDALPDAALMARAGGRLRRSALICLVSLSLASVLQAQAKDTGIALTPERGVKAAFLYKFAGYVDWPAGVFSRIDTPITIAVMGDDQLADALTEYVAGRTVDDRPLAVRKQKDEELPDGVHILFIAQAETARLKTAAKPGRAVLIVTESEGALANGSIINFLISGGRVRFEIAPESAEKRHLKLSSGLLRVAQNIRAGTP